MRVLDSISAFVAKVTKYVCAFVILALVLLTCTDVFIRLVFEEAILGTYDITQLMLAMIVFTSYVVTEHEGQMLHATFLVGKLPGKAKFVAWALGYLLSTAVIIGWAVGALLHVSRMMQSGAVTLTVEIPLWPFYLISAITLFMLCIPMILRMIKAILAIFRKEDEEFVRSQWTA